ncbi:ATP-binding protein [Luteibacter sp. dw_328]|uniref:ATP-binding protein n=1 Tax=Luteibacter sp. dw_328 TaxID=2719796 RepID=UPI001BD44BD8|nr:ATP-binding protein [Luteibacter sp. dw_328]
MDAQALNALWFNAGSVFTPGSPVNERDLFSGRVNVLNRILTAVSQRGYHGVLFGERGVGKTSLANILTGHLRVTQNYLVAKVNCDAGDTFSSIWHKAFRDITYTHHSTPAGFTGTPTQQVIPVASSLPSVVQPDDVRRLLFDLSSQTPTLIILDEYDRIADRQVAVLISDTIKSLSDNAVAASLLLIGVAESVDQLVEGHLSIERNLVQVPMPRMSTEEIAQIVSNGLTRLGMTISAGGLAHIVALSQGLPYITHLLALHSTRAALTNESMEVNRDHVDRGVTDSLDQWQQSIKSSYYDAVKSPQPGNIFKEVLLACALAEVDEAGYFTAAAVRSPLSNILGRTIDIPNFARHLKEFGQVERAEMLTRVGTTKRFRYRFVSPIMRPYIIMRGYVEGLIK